MMDEELRKKAEAAAKKEIEEAIRKKLAGISDVGHGFVANIPPQRPVGAAFGVVEPVLPAFGTAPYTPYQVPQPARPYILTVELLEDGMVVRYSYPVKKTVTTPGRRGFNIGMDPSIQLFFEGLAEVLGDGEEWNEESRKGKFARIFEKMNAVSAPKKVEKYFYETRSLVCKNAAELEEATKVAREAAKLIKELQDKGEMIHHGGHGSPLTQCFEAPPGGAYIAGESDYM